MRAAATLQSCPSTVLRGGRGGLELCSDLRHRTTSILLRDDRLVYGQFGADVLQNPAKDAASRRVLVVAPSRPDLVNVGSVDGNVDGIRLATPASSLCRGFRASYPWWWP